jgi:hypothetical protein
MKHNKLYMTFLLAIALSAFFAGYYCSQPAWKYVTAPVNYSDPNTPLPTVYQIQTLLVAKGKDIGPDGIDGRMKSCDTYDAWVKAICDQHAVNVWPKGAK